MRRSAWSTGFASTNSGSTLEPVRVGGEPRANGGAADADATRLWALDRFGGNDGREGELGFGALSPPAGPVKTRAHPKPVALEGRTELAHDLSETRRVVSALDLPRSIRVQACQLVQSAANVNLLPVRSIEAIAAASVFAACRCNGLPRTLE